MFKNWKPVDWIVLTIAAAVASIFLMMVTAVFIAGTSLTEEARRTLSTVIGSMLSIIALYVGAKVSTSKLDKNYETEKRKKPKVEQKKKINPGKEDI